MRPRNFYFFAARPSSAFGISQTKTCSASLSVTGDVPAGDGDFNFGLSRDSHGFGEISHPTAEVLGPLTTDVVGDKDPG